MFYDNFEKACTLKGEKPNPVAIKCGGTKSSASSWKKGSSPNSEIVVSIANYLNVSTDYLLLGEEHLLTEQQQQILDLFNQLSSDGKIRLLERAETILESEQNSR